MASVSKSMILEKLSGTVYGLVFKQYRKGVVISKIPDMSKVRRSAKQIKCSQEFARSVAQARAMINDPQERQALIEKASLFPYKKRPSLYHLAMRECMKKKGA